MIENIEVVEWEASCGDPDLNQGGIARSFINHRESEENGKECVNTTFRNVYIQSKIAGLICLNGLDHPINYRNLVLENFTLEQAPEKVNWIYANNANNNSSSIEIKFKNVRFGSRFIQQSDFKTKGTVNLSFENTGEKYEGYLNPNEEEGCSCTTWEPAFIQKNCKFKVHPVPTNDWLNIELDGINFPNGNLLIYSIEGELILNKTIESSYERINIEHLERGCYLLKLLNGSEPSITGPDYSGIRTIIKE